MESRKANHIKREIHMSKGIKNRIYRFRIYYRNSLLPSIFPTLTQQTGHSLYRYSIRDIPVRIFFMYSRLTLLFVISYSSKTIKVSYLEKPIMNTEYKNGLGTWKLRIHNLDMNRTRNNLVANKIINWKK